MHSNKHKLPSLAPTHYTEVMGQATQTSGWQRIAVLVLSSFAIGISAFITYKKLTGEITSLAGCGTGSGCANILGSKWSFVFGVLPVTLPAIGIYAVAIFSAFSSNRFAASLRPYLAWLLIAAALWFTALQLIVFSSLCIYCMSLHTTGLLLAFPLLYQCPSRFRPAAPACALVATAALALIQSYGPAPATSRLEQHHLSSKYEGFPTLGNPNAARPLVKFFDYTCASCRTMDGHLERLLTEHPAEFSIILVPCPLNRACNPNLPDEVQDHPGACELSRLALAVYRCSPGAFPEFHRYLFEKQPAQYPQALARAEELCPPDELARELQSPELDKLIARSTDDYQHLITRTPIMPKLLVTKTAVLQGAPASYDKLRDALLKPAP